MTLDAIKREINLRIREVKADSADFMDTQSYATLQSLLARAIERVAKCNSATELEAIDNLLGVIEECYNDCKSEKDGEPSDVTLFDFQFELDTEDDVSDDSEITSDDGDKSEESTNTVEEKAIDVSKEIAEVEEAYEKFRGQCKSTRKMRLNSLRRKAIRDIRSASSSAAVTTEVYKYRRKFKKFADGIEKAKAYAAAKPIYDEMQIVANLKKTNMVRAIFGVITAVGGAAYGLFEARWWPWENIAYAITAIGISYLLLSLIYAISIAKSSGGRTVRRLSFARIVLAVFFAIICLPLGIIFDDLGLSTFYLATIPFTICGAIVYLLYRLKLTVLVHKKKK